MNNSASRPCSETDGDVSTVEPWSTFTSITNYIGAIQEMTRRRISSRFVVVVTSKSTQRAVAIISTENRPDLLSAKPRFSYLICLITGPVVRNETYSNMRRRATCPHYAQGSIWERVKDIQFGERGK